MNTQPFVIERTYDAPIKKVWKAITDKEQMKEWYFDLADFRAEVGFEFQFTGGPDDRSYLHLCKVTEVIPGRKITYSWRYDGYEGESFVTFELFDEKDKTKLKLTHAGLETFPVSNPDFAKSNFEAGWNDIIGNLLKNFVEVDTIKREVEIDAPAEKVWRILVDQEMAKQWASAFSEGTQVDTDWKEGSIVLWKDSDGNIGAKGRVERNDGRTDLLVRFYDEVSAPEDSTLGEYVEHYNIKSLDNRSILQIEAGKLPLKHVEIHSPLWDAALAKMKELAEANN